MDASRLLRYLLETREIDFVVAKTVLRPSVAKEKADDRRIALGHRVTQSRFSACQRCAARAAFPRARLFRHQENWSS